MKELKENTVRLATRSAELWSDVEGSRLSAAFSFYAIFSIFPLLLLTVTVIGFVMGNEDPARAHLLDALAAPGTPVRSVLESTILAMQASRSARGLSAFVGLATLFFSASGAFVEIDNALNRIWGIPRTTSESIWHGVKIYVRERLAGFALVLLIGLTSLASLGMNAVLSVVAAHAPSPLRTGLFTADEICASVILLSIAFAAAFHFVPRERPAFRDVIGGAVLTATMLTILKTLFASWLSRLVSYSAYGIAGGVLAVAMWIYLSSLVIFLGACITRAACELSRPARDADVASTDMRLEA
jgi:membrane protein